MWVRRGRALFPWGASAARSSKLFGGPKIGPSLHWDFAMEKILRVRPLRAALTGGSTFPGPKTQFILGQCSAAQGDLPGHDV